ncbi:hypothetical protein V8C26DRAFT_410518 [Trichoderma gracile]
MLAAQELPLLDWQLAVEPPQAASTSTLSATRGVNWLGKCLLKGTCIGNQSCSRGRSIWNRLRAFLRQRWAWPVERGVVVVSRAREMDARHFAQRACYVRTQNSLVPPPPHGRLTTYIPLASSRVEHGGRTRMCIADVVCTMRQVYMYVPRAIEMISLNERDNMCQQQSGYGLRLRQRHKAPYLSRWSIRKVSKVHTHVGSTAGIPPSPCSPSRSGWGRGACVPAWI